jgi:type I restriction enzyme R subunit
MIGDLFDPAAEFFVRDRLRPHWSQAGAIVFVTFRTKDSLPHDVIANWDREKQDWIQRVLGHRRGSLCDPQNPETMRPFEKLAIEEKTAPYLARTGEYRHWKQLLPQLTDEQRRAFDFHFNRCRETKLDECLGACVLKCPELARIVANSLLHFDGSRYRMGDFVVMPNHIHLLAAFSTPELMERQFDSWLHFTAVLINRKLKTKGHFWQQEPFDHLVRSSEQYDYLRRYIAENPGKARLKPGEFYYRRFDGS